LRGDWIVAVVKDSESDNKSANRISADATGQQPNIITDVEEPDPRKG
jgi:hypothetical protein